MAKDVCERRGGRYRDLLSGALAVVRRLEGKLQREEGEKWGPRVGVYAKPSASYVTATWATWMLGGIVVPLAVSHTQRELSDVIQDAAVSMVPALARSPPSHSFQGRF